MASRRSSRMLLWNASAACGPDYTLVAAVRDRLRLGASW